MPLMEPPPPRHTQVVTPASARVIVEDAKALLGCCAMVRVEPCVEITDSAPPDCTSTAGKEKWSALAPAMPRESTTVRRPRETSLLSV